MSILAPMLDIRSKNFGHLIGPRRDNNPYFNGEQDQSYGVSGAPNPFTALINRRNFGGGSMGMNSLPQQLTDFNLGGPDENMDFNPYWQLTGSAPYKYNNMGRQYGENFGQGDLGGLFGQPTPYSSYYEVPRR